MKSSLILLLVSSLAALAATEEQINKRFTVQSGEKLVVEVDFGSIDVTTNASSEVVADVWRKVSRGSKKAEEEFLVDRPVTITQDGTVVTIRSRGKPGQGWSGRGRNQNEGRYTLSVPSQFSVHLKTAGGGITVKDLAGDVRANTSGGGLEFARLRGPLDGHTSGGGIRAIDCRGTLKIHTSGGGINVAGGSGTLDGETSGGPVAVKDFGGNARVRSSGGGIHVKKL